ncbi:ExbD/TolR family protein [Methylophaga sp. OBS4]|uniref:ExbD/TolR family protein n=1 Tax=Methylophaga sp. OBS4 TaxID=2991935 RepID=UPI002253528F|nr:biopolymer transporter ExbD [Methylophaga sp. OBS4]MCX4187565.1 biopolymer transporter ExbD [Methylophaga sp. OBS4]
MKVGQSIQHKKPNQDDGLIPLINIVFLMLIFFMVAGHISQSDPIKVQPPSSVSDKHEQEEAVVIIVATDGQVSFEQDIIELAALGPLVNQRFEQAENKPGFSLLVKVDANLAVEKLQDVLNIIKQTGIKRVSLATQRQTEPS